jgi:hypothetical protein
MAVKDIGIILNGATGRIGATQHLANALAPIRAEGGLQAGPDRIVPRLLLLGRDRAALAGLAQSYGIDDWTTDRDAALARPDSPSSSMRRPPNSSCRRCARRLPPASTSTAKSRWRLRSPKAARCCMQRRPAG